MHRPTYTYKKGCFGYRPIKDTSFTVLTTCPLRWITRLADGTWQHRLPYKTTMTWLSIEEHAALQTFPGTYVWPTIYTRALRQVANAVPPEVARLLFVR